MQIVGGNGGNQFRQGVGHYARNCTVRPRKRDAAAQKEEAGIQLQAEEYDLMAAVADLDEIEEVNANCILMANLQQASTSGTQTDSVPVYDTDGSAEHLAIEVEKVNSVNRKLKKTNEDMTTELERYKNQERAHTFGPSNKEGYAGNLPLCNKCKFYHTGPCAAKYGNYKRFGHQNRDCKTSVLRVKQRPSVAKQNVEVNCYECGELGHYKSDCPMWKFHNRVNKYWKEKALGDSSVIANNVDV
nr:reverse transcriptase domain-containing protein [Tanacetum cinerariifolium]